MPTEGLLTIKDVCKPLQTNAAFNGTSTGNQPLCHLKGGHDEPRAENKCHRCSLDWERAIPPLAPGRILYAAIPNARGCNPRPRREPRKTFLARSTREMGTHVFFRCEAVPTRKHASIDLAFDPCNMLFLYRWEHCHTVGHRCSERFPIKATRFLVASPIGGETLDCPKDPKGLCPVFILFGDVRVPPSCMGKGMGLLGRFVR